MAHPTTIPEVLEQGDPAAPAIGAPEGVPALSRAALRELAARTVETLNGLGVGRNDRVAIVLPNGPEMATAFLCIGSGATTAPLNPAYRAEEFEFYLTDLKAKALVVEAGAQTPAVEVARRLGVPVVELVRERERGAGAFALRAVERMDGAAARPGLAGPDDVALVLHTSGTTSRPKIVPLLQRNVTASATHIQGTLGLAPGDVCLNIMPLFHIHGLMAATLSSLMAGAQVSCSPGFNALKFFAWLDEVKPTWYTAVPTMHQAILVRAGRNPEIVQRTRLRFVRSSSSSLPPQVMAELERTFRAPVIEAYGMTEASHQMASNPLPPRPRKPGTVGVASGPEIAIMNDEGTILPAGHSGEIVVRGANVTRGYVNNPEANARSFTNGWFRTGDQGRIDDEGYVRIIGRIKEMINRGGEKVSPLEVDVVLMEH